MYGQNNYWRETQRPVRFFFLDARIVIFIGLALIHARLWTLILLLTAAIVMLMLEKRGINPGQLPRHVRNWLAGPVCKARHRSDLRTPVPLFADQFQ